MGLFDIARTAAAAAYGVAGDIVKSVVVKTGPSGVHNRTTDKTAVTWDHETTVPDALLYDSEEAELADGTNAPKQRLRMCSIQAVRLPVPPTEESKVVAEGLEWEVALVETDPAGANHLLTLRC